MGATINKYEPTQIALSTTGTLLSGVEGLRTLRITSDHATGTDVVYVELGAFVDGGALAAARAEPYLVSALPVEIDVERHGPVKLFGSTAINVTVTPR